MSIYFQIGLLLFTHWVADFVCQSHEMATNKSKDNGWLFIHVLVYSCVFLAPLIGLRTLTGTGNVSFIAITFTCHFITDFFTSKWTSKLFTKQDWHWLFVAVGFDQFLHHAQLIITYSMLIKYLPYHG